MLTTLPYSWHTFQAFGHRYCRTSAILHYGHMISDAEELHAFIDSTTALVRIGNRTAGHAQLSAKFDGFRERKAVAASGEPVVWHDELSPKLRLSVFVVVPADAHDADVLQTLDSARRHIPAALEFVAVFLGAVPSSLPGFVRAVSPSMSMFGTSSDAEEAEQGPAPSKHALADLYCAGDFVLHLCVGVQLTRPLLRRDAFLFYKPLLRFHFSPEDERRLRLGRASSDAMPIRRSDSELLLPLSIYSKLRVSSADSALLSGPDRCVDALTSLAAQLWAAKDDAVTWMYTGPSVSTERIHSVPRAFRIVRPKLTIAAGGAAEASSSGADLDAPQEVTVHPPGGHTPAGGALGTVVEKRGFCHRCVSEAPLSPEQGEQAARTAAHLQAHPYAQDEGYFVEEEAAYLRCEAAPACAAPAVPTFAPSGPLNPTAAFDALLLPFDSMRAPRDLGLPPGARIVVQGESSRGRYSNLRNALLDYLQLGLFTNRSVVAAPMAFSEMQCRESLPDLYDWPHLNRLIRVVAPPPVMAGAPRQRLAPHCLPDGAAATAPELQPVMLLNMERHFKYQPRSTTLLPTWGQWKVAGGVAWAVRPYTARWQLMRHMSALENHTCVGLSSGFWIFPYWGYPDAERLQNALRPAPAIQAVIDAFMANPLISARNFIGIHMRLTDIGFSNATFCQRDLAALFARIRDMQADSGASSLALATDDFDSKCARAFFGEFPETVAVRSGAYHKDSCSEAQFVHEVLAKGACFIGSINSTMTLAVEGIRIAERARNVPAKEDCIFREAAGQTRFEW